MRRLLALVPLAAALAACTPSHPPASPPPATDGVAPPLAPAAAPDAQALAASGWQLDSAVDRAGQRIDALFPAPDRHLQLEFADGRVSVSGGCNRMSGDYTLAGDRLAVGPLGRTKMFCGGGALMAADDAIAARLSAGGTLASGGDGTLVLTTDAGDRLGFSGTPTAQTRHGGTGERVFLEVAPERVACHHPLIPDFRCLHVREVKYDAGGLKSGQGEWQFFYGEIEGYTHQQGVRNVLRVNRFDVADPPADGSSVAWVLDMVVESETVTP
ncbi:META and DUF4377 domain-containing protein [Luteimonas saliphila]|uniref:META and DUF4377 domain-containing protein n=1 Tax=Luteimonas saliphila TaxID=2804919 RepID=UPI00192E18BF|nr:META and DUF4377 domain-containing protein [Luteimonas saliphila]